MILDFKTIVPIRETMAFEEVFEEELRLELEEKQKLLNKATAVWLFVNGKLAGETYGVRLSDLEERIEDCEDLDGQYIYCYSTALLPEFQGMGLGTILKTYWLGMTKRSGCKRIVGHATSDYAVALNRKFGASFSTQVHKNWYGTNRNAVFYDIVLEEVLIPVE